MIFLFLLVWPLAAVALSDECFRARTSCFDDWEDKYHAVDHGDCSACGEYIECMDKARDDGVCPFDTVFVEEVHEASIKCGVLGRGLPPYTFPDFGESHADYKQGVSFDFMYEFVSDREATYEEASDFCSEAGGSLYTAKHGHEFVSLKLYLLNDIPDLEKFWIGLNDKITEGEYRFEDGSKLHWDFFAENEGTKDTEGFFGIFRRRGNDCVSMDRVGEGFVMNCNERLPFICQYRGTSSHVLG